MKNIKLRDILITVFVIVWTVIFHYESTRAFYLQRWLGRPLPKLKLLFPPAGWIMFYEVTRQSGHVEVYGVKDGVPQAIDPHDIFRTRTLGYDNIHRGIMSVAANEKNKTRFCGFLRKRFPYFDRYVVTYDYYPDIIKERQQKRQTVLYQCAR
jgi:hypothetical protein